MKHLKHIGFGRHFSPPDELSGHPHRGRHHGHGRPGRLFDYGELRLLILALIAEAPSHGYELIKSIEERFGGSYSPSPGVVYPTLSWLEDMGYTIIEPQEGGRKRYRITTEGEAFLSANRSAVDELVARGSGSEMGSRGRKDLPPQVLRAMESLKLAMRLRLRRGPLDEEAADRIAAALDQAVQIVERS